MGIARIYGVGGITKDVTLRQVQVKGENKSVCDLNLAFDSGRKDAEGNQIPYYVRTTLWGGSAEYAAARCKKETRVVLEGTFAGDIVSTGQDGTEYHNLTVDNARIEIPNVVVSDANGSAPAPAPAPTQQTPPPAPAPTQQTPPPAPENIADSFVPAEGELPF